MSETTERFKFDLDRIRELESLPEDVASERVRAFKARYGKDLVLLAHLYQRRSIQQLADFTGDSYMLSKNAAENGARYIVFCGVRFMAESAAILAGAGQAVVHPDPEAGCPMADMAPIEEVRRAWDLFTVSGRKVIPVTYMNSTADIKAFCGERGGLICTSSNAAKAFQWAFDQGADQVFFLPDEHLGRNTALQMGLTAEDLVVYDPEKKSALDAGELSEARVVLWRGYCPVHQRFTVRDVEHVRRFYPKAQVLVHPECPAEVVQQADAVGSTEFIRQYVAKTKPGDEIFIGTEINLVQNLQAEYPDRLIAKLHRSLCLTMYQITMGRLLYALENLEAIDKVTVDPDTRRYAKLALDRMLALPK